MATKWTAKDFESNNSWSAKDFEPVKPKSVMFTPPKLSADNIFVDAPKSVSSLPFNPRKQLNTVPITQGLEKKNYSLDEWNKMSGIDKILAGIKAKKEGNTDYVPREDLYKQEVNKQANSKLGAGIAGFANAASLGSFEAGAKAQTKPFALPNIFNESEKQNPISYNVGKMAGYVAPAIGGAGLTKPLLTKITNPLLNRVAEGAIVGGAMTGIEDTFQGKSLKETGKDIALNAVLGAGLDVGLYGLGKVAKSAFPKWTTSFEDGFKPKEIPIKEVAATKPNTVLSGKYNVKNTALENAQKTYDDAIETIQNHFKTNQLTPEEIVRIKPELGIDIDELIKNVDTAKTNVRAIGENQRLAAVAGVKEVPNIKLQKPLTPTIKPLQEVAATSQKPSLGATDRLHSLTQIVSSDEAKTKVSIKDRWSKLYTRFVDSVSPTKKISENTHILATNTKNAGGIVDNILTENLVDRQGKKIGESFKNIVKDIPENKQDDFMNYVLQRHNIDRAREGKNVYTDFTPEESLKAVQLIEQQFPEYKALNDRLVKFVRDFESEWGNKSGLISDEVWQNLQDTYKNYVPTQRSFDELEQGFSAANGRGFVDQGNTLKKATGSERDIVNPLENIMKLVNKTVRTAKYNEVGQSMLSEIRKDPIGLKNLGEIIPEGVEINPNVKNIVSVLENGNPVNVKVNNVQLLEALQGITKANVGDIEAAVKKGTNIFKSLITTKNPVFAVRNIARDIPTAYINGSEANPLKFARDLVKAGKDIVTNSENFQQYKGVGGGGSNFFKSDNTAKSVKELTKTSLLKKVGNGIENINNIIESAPRLAEFNRILDKTGDVNKALFAASDVTTNFSRGGDITKHIDSFVPYLNAGVQGLDKLARQFVNKPIPTAAKGLVGITSLTLVLDHVNKDNPEYKKLDNRTKDNYFIFPDANNDGKFVKIPKSRELGVLFGSLFERSLRASRGETNSFKGFGNTVRTNFSPANPFEANIFSPALGIRSNKDFANRDIVPRAMIEDNRSKYLQYDEKTSEITKAIAIQAKKAGVDLSPKQMDYLIKSYTGVIGQLGLPATTKNTMTGTTAEKLLKPITTQFIADPMYSNQITTDFYDNYDNIKSKAADKNITKNISSKVLTPEERIKSKFTKASNDMSALNKKVKEAEAKNDLEEVKKLRKKILETAVKANTYYNENKK